MSETQQGQRDTRATATARRRYDRQPRADGRNGAGKALLAAMTEHGVKQQIEAHG